MGQDLLRFLGDLVVAPGQVPGQADVAGGRIETQVGQGAGVVVHRSALASAARA